MNSHQQKVLKFLLSPAGAGMSKKEAAAHVDAMKEEDWKEHLKKRKPDGTCRAGCPLHSKRKKA